MVLCITLAWGAIGCATTGTDPRDPYEPFNRRMQKFNDNLDNYIFKPIAKGYKAVTPAVVDRGITNFFNNIGDISVFTNDFLQGKPKQGGADLIRFVANTTLGIGGLFDVATQWGLERHDEDFGQTLNTWGVPQGPYLVLPLFGPNTATSITSIPVDGWVLNPVSSVWLDAPEWQSSGSALNIIDLRADNLSATNIVDQASLDRYAFIRNAWFQRRNFLITDGQAPVDDIENEVLDLDLNQAPSAPMPIR